MKTLLTLLTALMLLTSCAIGPQLALRSGDAGYDGSKKGVGAQLSLGQRVGPLAVHALGSYNRLSFDGGHDNLYTLGAQLRKRFGSLAFAGAFWAGVEAAYVHETAVFDQNVFAENPGANGYSIGALFGYELPTAQIFTINLYGGVSLLHLGDFKSKGTVAVPGKDHVLVRVGASFGLPVRF